MHWFVDDYSLRPDPFQQDIYPLLITSSWKIIDRPYFRLPHCFPITSDRFRAPESSKLFRCRSANQNCSSPWEQMIPYPSSVVEGANGEAMMGRWCQDNDEWLITFAVDQLITDRGVLKFHCDGGSARIQLTLKPPRSGVKVVFPCFRLAVDVWLETLNVFLRCHHIIIFPVFPFLEIEYGLIFSVIPLFYPQIWFFRGTL